jgi:hypothetical protein
MRTTFLILLLLNLLAFLVWTGHLGNSTEGREPQRLNNQMRPDALSVQPPTPPMKCRQVDDLDETQLAKLQQKFRPLRDVALATSAHTTPGSYWVAITGIGTRELAVRKQAELVKLGVITSELSEDAQHGPFVLVLGTTDEASAAQKITDELLQKGVRSARMVTRTAPQTRHSITLRWPEPVAAERREQLQSWLNALPGAQALQVVACAKS